MVWSEGDQWLLTLDLPAGTHEFKLVASAGAQQQVWEAGPNRALVVPAAEAAAHGAFTVVCEWGNTAACLETLPEGELEADEGLPGVRWGRGRVDELRLWPRAVCAALCVWCTACCSLACLSPYALLLPPGLPCAPTI